MASMMDYTPMTSDVNQELNVTSSNASIISVSKITGTRIELYANKAGTSTITIKTKIQSQKCIHLQGHSIRSTKDHKF